MSQKQGLSVYLLIDNSGSMRESKTEVREGYNAFLRRMKDAIMPTHLTMAYFDNNIQMKVDNRLVPDVPEMQAGEYYTGGGTSLVACINAGIKKLAGMNTDQRVLIVLTDGQDYFDPSHEAYHATFRDEIKKLQKDGWSLMFVATDQDAMTYGTNMGFAKETILDFSRGKVVACMESAADAALRFSQTRDAKASGFTTDERKKSK